MSKGSQSFHPKVIIVDHFDEIINQIDIKTETLLMDQSLSGEARNELNKERATQIKSIDEIKQLNLSHLPHIFNEFEYGQKWSHILDNESFDYKQKIDRIKEELILFDCVLLDNPNSMNGCTLWITSWYYNEKNLDFLK